jgi:pyruvate formate-lyase/glycerol dehydratase family glycyl radical enzyme
MTSLLPFRIGLKLMGLGFKFSKKMRREIYNPSNNFVFNKKIQVTTRSGDSNGYIVFKNGTMRSSMGIIEDPDLKIVCRNKEVMNNLITGSPEQSLDYLLSGDIYNNGNLSYLTKFSYLGSIFPKKAKKPPSSAFPGKTKITEEQSKIKTIENLNLNKKVDEVKYLNDPYLGKYKLEDFPVLYNLKNNWFSEHAWLCDERAKNVTDFHNEHGFENTKDGKAFDPDLRQGMALKYILSKKKPIIFNDDLLPGTTTSKRIGVQMFPELGGVTIWPELHTMQSRDLNPYHISEDAIKNLNDYIFPYWMDRCVREKTRAKFGNQFSQRLDEFFCLYFEWKPYAISHTIPDFELVLKNGLSKVIENINEKIKVETVEKKINFYNGMKHALEGVLEYSQNLRNEAENQLRSLKGKNHSNGERMKNLERIVDSLNRIPHNPAETFMDSIVEIWILFLCFHQENMNAGLSLGRLDQILYPYFVKSMENAGTNEEKEKQIQEIINLIGAFYFKCQDHLPLVPNVGNKLFGGSSSDQALTLGGVTPEGKNGVNDLTYIFLKVTEMLGLRDPNVNAKFHPDFNSDEYLKRLCEVNINTTSTPSLHNDKEMIEVMVEHGFKIEDARNWGATGCVEPTSIGKHFGHTGCIMFNTIAPLEILIGNGYHPLIHPQINSVTKLFQNENFPTFEDLFEGYKAQLRFIVDQCVEYNNNLGLIHQEVHPTPLLSAIFQGPLEEGKDLVRGGAIYNSTGVALVAVSDVIDSLMALKKIVYEQKNVSLQEFKIAMKRDFKGENDKILYELIKKTPKFGSNDSETNKMAADLLDFLYTTFKNQKNYRGGEYRIGLWSMSNHVAFGKLSGTMPSGRLKGKSFTPGITPAPSSSDQLLNNIKSVAKLDSKKTPNNIAFNVKLIPGPNDSHEKTVENFTSYTKSYFDLGGLQMQFNVVTSEMLREAMLYPENYRWLMVRISGYNAYFTSLNEDMQMELVERYEYNT